MKTSLESFLQTANVSERCHNYTAVWLMLLSIFCKLDEQYLKDFDDEV